ncbi:MAG: peptidyl-prolyl cis-trans isomerase [Bacteroidetes bacterium]|jgi:peptidyl-prolyl cis-trans isomerase SurA|nr:peptidyl-prolyl cis-trans isomerase [Bacteroidota bacterium]
MPLRPHHCLLAAVGLLALILSAGCASTSTTATSSLASDSNVVAIFDGEAFTLNDFEREYANSVGGWDEAQDDSLGAYVDFLERFVDFRLKVKAAEAAGYATDSSVQTEIRNYRASFAKPYLMDKEVINPIVKELYERKGEMVDVSHILIRAGRNASPEDTMAAYTRIQALRDSLANGADFGELAYQYSQDPSARERDGQYDHAGYRGRLGFVTAGRMVAPFEDAAYATPVGEISDIVRTRFGYHLVKVHDRKPARRDIRIAHIMISPGSELAPDTAEALALVERIQERLDQGEAFADLAKSYSADKRSGLRGGDLGWQSFDNYNLPGSFREAAFAIDSVGAVTGPVETRFGYHLIKLLDRKERGTLEEEYEDLKQTVSRLPRTQAAETELRRDILAAHGAALDTALVTTLFDGVAADSVIVHLTGQHYADTLADATFATLGDSTYSVADWQEHATSSQMPKKQEREAQIYALADQFMESIALDYEAAALEERDSEFRRIMREFRDGLMLFQLMEDSVWTAASQDTAGIRAYFDEHREEYRFPERTRVIGLFSSSDSVLTATLDRIDAGALTLDQLATQLEQDTTATMRLDTMLISERTDTAYDMGVGLEPGEHTNTIRDRGGQAVMFNDGTVPARPKTLDEARAEVVTAYQEVLEDQLVADLRERYGARTFPSRLDRAFQGTPPDTMKAGMPDPDMASPQSE